MLFNYIKIIIFYLSLLLAISIKISAFSSVEVSSSLQPISLLEKSQIALSSDESTVKSVVTQKVFHPYAESYFNLGLSQHYVWIRVKLKNSSAVGVDKALVFSSPLLESIALYQDKNDTAALSGLFTEHNNHKTISYYYQLHLEPFSEMNYYIRVHSFYNPLGFSMTLEDENQFLKEDHVQQLITVLLIGMLLALMFYAISVSFYLKESGYLYYALYLAFIVYQQLTYMGLTQIYCSYTCIVFDMKIAVFKVSLMMLTSALFAMQFLKTKEIPWLHLIYKIFITLISHP